MLKLKVKIRCNGSNENYHWGKGQELILTNNIFNKENGFAFNELDKCWDIIEMEVLEYEKLVEDDNIIYTDNEYMAEPEKRVYNYINNNMSTPASRKYWDK